MSTLEASLLNMVESEGITIGSIFWQHVIAQLEPNVRLKQRPTGMIFIYIYIYIDQYLYIYIYLYVYL